MRIIVGLGNPGVIYQNTRHNLGFRVIERLAERWAIPLTRRALLSLIGEGYYQGEKVLLVQPQTYMNRSGEAVARICTSYPVTLADLILVHDDLDMPLGRIRIKRGGGGAGGNRGVASVIAALGSKDFARVKIGIGRPPPQQDPADYVLQPFTQSEEAFILPAIERAADAVETLLREGIEKAMARFNTVE
ncbi:MAG: aminoacyl-tRNA hydrolase [Candidatus Binatia bacterium]|nr:aminoacyl-tRNA hydrolase [Candidatus Binatia bacterium]